MDVEALLGKVSLDDVDEAVAFSSSAVGTFTSGPMSHRPLTFAGVI